MARSKWAIRNAEKLAEYNREWFTAHPEYRKEYNKRYYAEHKEELRAKQKRDKVEKAELLKSQRRARTRKQKEEVIAAYGGKCACCGEAEIDFLSIDHVKGGGKKHLKELRMLGSTFYRWLRNQGFPQDEFQCLCFNCNHGKAIGGGICPHSKRDYDLTLLACG